MGSQGGGSKNKTDAEGPNWIDVKITEAFSCRTKTVEYLRQSLVMHGFEGALIGKKCETTMRLNKLEG